MCGKYNCLTFDKLYGILFINLGDMMKKIIKKIKLKIKSEKGFTMQDLLKLGKSARMNTPGVPSGNWEWKLDGLNDDVFKNFAG